MNRLGFHAEGACRGLQSGSLNHTETVMNQTEILRKVTAVTARVLNLDPESIRPDSNFVFDLGAESSQSVELVASFEEEFGVELDEDAALAISTVSGAAEFLGKYVNH